MAGGEPPDLVEDADQGPEAGIGDLPDFSLLELLERGGHLVEHGQGRFSAGTSHDLAVHRSQKGLRDAAHGGVDSQRKATA